jgi:hypothetical protein
MNAEDILNALRRSYPTAAFVPELLLALVPKELHP